MKDNPDDIKPSYLLYVLLVIAAIGVIAIVVVIELLRSIGYGS